MENKRQDSYYNIFKYIVDKGETTRREIEKATGYSWGTVSSNVCALMDDGLIKETRNVINGVGRSTYFLSANGKYVTIGVDLNAIGLSCTIAEINGKIINYFMTQYEAETKEDVIALIFSTFDKAFDWIGDKYHVFSIGLSCQGGVDPKTGYFTNFNYVKKWEPVNLKKILEDRYHIFSVVNNDMRALCMDYIRKYHNDNMPVMIVRLVDGVGFSIVPFSDKYRRFTRCEFGHTILDKNGELCSCGKRGCLEAYASIRGILRRVGLTIKDREKLFLESYKYQKYIDEAADYLGLALLNCLAIFDVDKVILTGRMIDFGPKFIEDIKKSYDKYKNNSGLNSTLDLITIPNLSPSFGIAMYSVEEKIKYEQTK